MQNQLKNLALVLYRFSTQQGKTRKRFINIAKMLEHQKTQQASQPINSPFINNPNQKSSPHKNFQNQATTMEQIFTNQWQSNPSDPFQSGYEHLSAQQQQTNHKIKTAIRAESIYHQCTKNKHKLEPRQYALMFCKILQLRKNVPKQRKQTQGFGNFLKIIQKKMEKMPPQELVRIVFAMKHEGVNKHQLKLLRPIIQKIIKEFSNTQNTELDPKSFETFKLSTSIKLFHSFAFLLQHTGSHFEQKLKQIMNETLNYILFNSMKTKKHSKSGEYFPLKLKMNFLALCKDIDASAACIKNLILAVLVQKQKLYLQTLLDLQATIFDSPQVLQRTRRQLFIQKDIHIKYNIFYRIQHYIQEQIPTNLKKSSNYSLLTKNLVKHLSYITQFTFDELKIMEMNSHKDEQVFRVLAVFHQAYKNCLIENFASINQKQDAMNFFRKSQHQEYALYELLSFFYLKLKKDGPNSIRPSTKKQLKDFIGLLTKFYTKLNFLTQSIIIEILVMSNFTNLKPIMIEYLELNALLSTENNAQRVNFFVRDKTKMTDTFFQMIKCESTLRQNCPVQYQVFMKSNIKTILKFILKSNDQQNIEKYAFYLATYCKTFNQQELKSFIDQVIQLYVKQSWSNRAFKKDDVDAIYKNKEYFLSSEFETDPKELENQTDIFGQNVAKKEQTESHENQKLFATLENDKEIMREFYDLQQKIRFKLRNLFRNFKFLVLFLENIKLNHPKNVCESVINEELYSKLLSNFKTELECMKFERLLTKQNCSQVMDIYEFLKDIWSKTTSGVQIRNEFLMYKNEQIKYKNLTKEDTNQSQSQSLEIETKVKEQEKNDQQFIDEQEQQSQQGEYTQEIEYLKGKDLISLETVKVYNEKQQKSQAFFGLKNKECLTEVKRLTKDFAQLPKGIQKVDQKVQILTKLVCFYSMKENLIQQKIKVKNLSLDGNRMAKYNLSEVLSVQVQNNENRVIYTLKVYTKQYPSLDHIREANKCKDQQNKDKKVNLMDRIYYVHSSKLRRNKKRLQEISQINQKQNTQTKKSQQHAKQEGFSLTLSQNPNKNQKQNTQTKKSQQHAKQENLTSTLSQNPNKESL